MKLTEQKIREIVREEIEKELSEARGRMSPNFSTRRLTEVINDLPPKYLKSMIITGRYDGRMNRFLEKTFNSDADAKQFLYGLADGLERVIELLEYESKTLPSWERVTDYGV